MPSYSRNEVILVNYPFTDLSGTKVRPAVVVQTPHVSPDILIVPLTSRIANLRSGEFLLADWAASGLHVPTAAKRGIYTIHPSLVVKRLGQLSPQDGRRLDQSLRGWLGV